MLNQLKSHYERLVFIHLKSNTRETRIQLVILISFIIFSVCLDEPDFQKVLFQKQSGKILTVQEDCMIV